MLSLRMLGNGNRNTIRWWMAAILALSVIPVHAQFSIGSGKVDELFQVLCATCHGKQMEGGSAPSLLDDTWLVGGDDASIASAIREGIPGTEMVAYKALLSEDQIRSLVIYIRENRLLNEQGNLLEKITPREGVITSEHHSFEVDTVFDGSGTFWSLDWLPDGSMLITEKSGSLLHVMADGRVQTIEGTPAVWDRGQGGMLEVQLHPNYAENGWIYLAYSRSHDNGDTGLTSIQRGRIREGAWVDSQMIFDPSPEFHTSARHHFGTRLVFSDGYLFFSIGDRGDMETAQDLTLPNGKMHRIHDDGRIPEDNPFADMDGSFPSIWSYGHRNPQGIDLDPRDGRLWITEHGPRGGDETNLVKPGLNYGWPVITYGMNYNGTPITDKTEMDGMEQPKLYWTPSIAVCGIDFYEGDVFPEWKHNLFVGGLASEQVHRLVIEEGEVVHEEIILKNEGRVRDVASGPDGRLYLVLNGGPSSGSRIVRLNPAN